MPDIPEIKMHNALNIAEIKPAIAEMKMHNALNNTPKTLVRHQPACVRVLVKTQRRVKEHTSVEITHTMSEQRLMDLVLPEFNHI